MVYIRQYSAGIHQQWLIAKWLELTYIVLVGVRARAKERNPFHFFSLFVCECDVHWRDRVSDIRVKNDTVNAT